MKKLYILIIVASASLLLSNCGDELADELIGTWNTISWTVEGVEKADQVAVKFIFNRDKSYEAHYGSKVEKGTFRVFGRNLYTTEEGKLEKLVKFDFDEDLNLVFAMNRVGTSEQMILKKVLQ